MGVRWVEEDGGRFDGRRGLRQSRVTGYRSSGHSVVEEEVAGFDEGVEGGVGVGGGDGGEGLAV